MENFNLTEDQSNALIYFQEITQIDSNEIGIQCLSMHNWDVQRAVNTVLTPNSDLPSTPEIVQNEQRIPPVTSVTARYMPNYALQLFRTPLSFLYTFYLKLQPFLPWRIIRAAFSFFRSIIWTQPRPYPRPYPGPDPGPYSRPGPRPDPLREIEDYCRYFNNEYDTKHPTFYQGLLSQVLRDVQREVRLLFIYIHDKNSTLCDRFCHEVLCRDAIQLTVGDNLFWSTSLDTQEGAAASRLLTANFYPCLCIIAHHGSQQTIQFKLDRYTDCDQCLAEIINAVENANQTLQYNRERRTISNSRDRLLEEQNAAYLDSVRIDQEKAEQRQREENERRKLEEEEQKKLQEFTDFRDRLRQSLPSEPSSTENDIIQVSIRLPDNEPIKRRFQRTDSAKLLFEFAWTNVNVPNQFELLWGYPRKRYQYEQLGDEIIGDLMKGNTETCFLEQIDEDR
ncbi:unnamed protein product [Adineta steineri]|uniref:UBX domain-containing protein n=1 Tax=Adineta steineri TaxID=433720 RepID=A0A815KRQ1_9BILA|nr:unnamed protein product [Adineta steineri]CAF1613828.1 unnamed protein product [Adineta steineri]